MYQDLDARHSRAAKLTEHRCDFATFFDVVVGPKQKKFTLYRDVMVQRSEFFRAARSNQWIKDDPTRPTSLVGEDPEVFAAYAHTIQFGRVRVEGFHLYDTGNFEGNTAFDEGIEKCFEGDAALSPLLVSLLYVNERCKGLFQLYALSNMLLDYETANMVVDEVIRTRDLTKWAPTHTNVALLYSSTVAGDGMRNLICDYYVTMPDVMFPENASEASELDWPPDFFQDLAINFVRLRANQFTQEPSYPASYCVDWNPSKGQHRYHSGPGTEGSK